MKVQKQTQQKLRLEIISAEDNWPNRHGVQLHTFQVTGGYPRPGSNHLQHCRKNDSVIFLNHHDSQVVKSWPLD